MAKRARRLDDEDDGDLPANYVAPPEPWQTDDCDAARAVRKILNALDVGEIDAPTRFALHRIVYQCDRWLKFGIPGTRPGLGQERVVLTLRCILESTGNEGALTELIVRAVAGTISEFEDRGLELIEAFDKIPLLRIVDMMRELEYFRQSDAVLALSTILRNKLRRILTPPEPVKPPSAKERIAADKEALSAVRAAEIERNIDLGRTLVAIRDKTPCNRLFGWAVRSQFDLTRQHASELMRVARRYAERPEIHEKAKLWRVLVNLSASTLPEPRRQEFEHRILAGENVRANEITAAGVRSP